MIRNTKPGRLLFFVSMIIGLHTNAYSTDQVNAMRAAMCFGTTGVVKQYIVDDEEGALEDVMHSLQLTAMEYYSRHGLSTEDAANEAFVLMAASYKAGVKKLEDSKAEELLATFQECEDFVVNDPVYWDNRP